MVRKSLSEKVVFEERSSGRRKRPSGWGWVTSWKGNCKTKVYPGIFEEEQEGKVTRVK
jgi:hypothetical protein